MADYIYLLENRLTAAQQSALSAVREIARAREITLFLVGGAVRDLTSGSPVRDLDVVVQGNALKLRKDLEKAGGQIAGEHDASQALYVRFPGNVRVEVASTLTASYPKPGKPKYEAAAILDDLRRRDFTANAMALSLNEGSYGLLMDPLNGVADIENRELRLVSNYGFIEDPVRMIRSQRLASRLGWVLEEKTQQRYETGKAEGYISALGEFERGYELEEIVHEEDPLRVLQRLEAEGWMKVLCPAWTAAKVNEHELEKLREVQGQLQMQGVLADASAVQFPLLTAKMSPKDVEGLKKSFPRQGFVAEIEALEAEGKQFAAELGSKKAGAPSAAWGMIFSTPPEVVLWAAYTTRSQALQAKFKSFYSDWPAARQRIPYALMQEMRIVPELEGYNELVERIFFELMDARLGTAEEMKAFLEPHSPPAPPPPVNMRRARGTKGPRAAKGKKKVEESGEEGGESGLPEEVADEAAHALPSSELGEQVGGDTEAGKGEAKVRAAAPAKSAKHSAPVKAPVEAHPAKAAPAQKGGTAAKAAAVKAPAKAAAKGAVKSAGVSGKKPLAAKAAPAKATPAKAAKAAAPAKKAVGKGAAAGKAKPGKAEAKAAHKAVKAPAKAAKTVAKHVAHKGAKAVAARGKPAPAKKVAPHKAAKKR